MISGTLTTGMSVQNTSTDTKESISSMIYGSARNRPRHQGWPRRYRGDSQIENTKTGNTLVAAGSTVRMPDLDLPQPVMFMAVEAKTQADEDKLSTAIHRLLDSDPTLHYEKQIETKQALLKGLGDVHLDVAVALMKSQTNVNVTLSTGALPESITAQAKATTATKQVGWRRTVRRGLPAFSPQRGRGGRVVRQDCGWLDPGTFIPLLRALRSKLAGAVAGYLVQNVNVEVYDGSYHPVDSKEIAFKIAGMRAFRERHDQGQARAEPIMRLKITIPGPLWVRSG